MSKKKLDREKLRKMENALHKRPRSGVDLLKITNEEYLPYLERLAKKNDILFWRVWDNGFRFVYWIKPKRMGKVWKRAYARLGIGTEDGLMFGKEQWEDHTAA